MQQDHVSALMKNHDCDGAAAEYEKAVDYLPLFADSKTYTQVPHHRGRDSQRPNSSFQSPLPPYAAASSAFNDISAPTL